MTILHRAWSADEALRQPALEPVREAAPVPEAPVREAARAMMWSLEAGGWTAREAGNLVGVAHGLRPAISGWNEREIEHLRFLRALVETRRLDH